ncbi:uncharacterized protein LOC141875993 isoform X2 [Acropora palmata]|uniref:uncharacterized protein LOC141875993 isoform X2 n=1 Tax=Acropora palmata TaxID=6131 RepID=UPI003DA05B6E
MWTAISSYIWGESDEQTVPGSVVDIQGDDDWILVELRESKLAADKEKEVSKLKVQVQMEESWNSSTPRSEEVTKVEKRQPRRTVQFQAKLDLIEKRQQTEPPLEGGIRPNKKGLKKQNMVHFQNNTKSKRNKKRNRMLGKHVGMHGKRGC